MRLTGWQRRWVDRTFAPGVRVSALSLSRANGKTALCGWLCAEALRPGSELFDASAEVVIVSASMEQTRTLFGFVQDAIAARAGRSTTTALWTPINGSASATSRPGLACGRSPATQSVRWGCRGLRRSSETSRRPGRTGKAS